MGRLLAVGRLGLILGKLAPRTVQAKVDGKYTNAMPNVKTSFTRHLEYPEVNPTAYVHLLASVIGSVYLGKRVMVSPCASVRGDECTPIYKGVIEIMKNLKIDELVKSRQNAIFANWQRMISNGCRVEN